MNIRMANAQEWKNFYFKLGCRSLKIYCEKLRQPGQPEVNIFLQTGFVLRLKTQLYSEQSSTFISFSNELSRQAESKERNVCKMVAQSDGCRLEWVASHLQIFRKKQRQFYWCQLFSSLYFLYLKLAFMVFINHMEKEK